MPRQKNPCTPSYRKHKPSGRAVVTVDDRDFYLGPWESKASKLEYDRLIAEWLANGRRMPAASTNGHASPGDYSIVELVLDYIRFAEEYHVKDGVQTKEVGCMKSALSYAKRLYGHTPASQFGPGDAECERRAEQRRNRKTPLWPGHIRHQEHMDEGAANGDRTVRNQGLSLAFSHAAITPRPPSPLSRVLVVASDLRRG